MHLSSALTTVALVAASSASPIEERLSCPYIHVFGARETTAPVGYGSAGTFVNLILNAYPGSTAEAIAYPAQGGTNSAYASSVQTGTQNIANQINELNKKCPSSKLVVVGYSQGAQIGDNALCGGGDPGQGISYTNSLITSAAATAIKAVIWAGNPRNSPAETFHYGTCDASGFDPRPSGFSCPAYQTKIRSYCDGPDPYCCNGSDANTHQGYGAEYGQNALAFVKTKLG
ncbi:Putative cutinase/acetylxylan esterase, alpha/Beta hydrolase [Septoria linicola]|uniref:Cutinase/acetylxylan esterase, alpha/Beta hydrolase n=1 Tax=Septoria linicola TaxID=215465 RepID=A0A9Q9AZX7_9PEZI|nr:putative cutinase/acetylxylan esterase, alpha/Beta hydrolase [Septoria linicola]USW59122.1 Putative cutinase/acetylxylan esterase, alpha/Beta hydrolase [Septoria linicola]